MRGNNILSRDNVRGKCATSSKTIQECGCVFRKEIWIMDPAADQYYRWLTIIAGPVFYNLMMIVTR